MSAVLRLKRKACAEPVEGLVIALKKSRCQETFDGDKNEVLFKFAATLKTQTESVKDHLQAALFKDRSQKLLKWRDPKGAVVKQKNVQVIYDKLRKEYKAASEKKKLDLLNNRRLILSETVPIEEEIDCTHPTAEVRKLFQLYDIIEESEDTKKQPEETESIITCNGEPLIRGKTSEDYVYDVYIADVHIDDSFVENPVSLRPCTITDEDIYSGDSDSTGECFEDEDDSNDENNWRNDYPEDEESGSDKESEEEYVDGYNPSFWRTNEASDALDRFHIEDDYASDEESFEQSRILRDLSACDDNIDSSE